MKKYYQYEQVNSVFKRLSNNEPIHLVDVRSREEFLRSHATKSISIPLDELDSNSLKAKIGSQELNNQNIYLLCQMGIRSEQAAEKLHQQGLKNLRVIKGGINAWMNSNLPISNPVNSLSLEQQTLIAVGILLLVVLAKGLMLHPLFFALIAVIAIGLIAAAFTGKCTLTALLAKMPWNQIQRNSPA